MTRAELESAGARELARAFAAGRVVDPEALAGWHFHGTSLGLPAWIERLTWKTFLKAFERAPDGRVLGWNVRVVQRWHDRAAAPFTPRRSRGAPVTFGHFEVVSERGGVMLDYGRGRHRRLDPVAALRDPLVALDDRCDRLLGRSLVALPGFRVPTRSWFVLERGAPLSG